MNTTGGTRGGGFVGVGRAGTDTNSRRKTGSLVASRADSPGSAAYTSCPAADTGVCRRIQVIADLALAQLRNWNGVEAEGFATLCTATNVAVHAAKSNESAVADDATGLLGVLLLEPEDARTDSGPSIVGHKPASAWTGDAVCWG